MEDFPVNCRLRRLRRIWKGLRKRQCKAALHERKRKKAMDWIDVNENLPLYDGQPTYDWVIVSSKDLRWTIARYGHKNINGELIPSWEFFDTNEDETGCCYAGDSVNILSLEEIRYWLDIEITPYERKNEIELQC